jgi:hypothetical protein
VCTVLVLPAILSPLEGISQLYRKLEIKRWSGYVCTGIACDITPNRGYFPTLQKTRDKETKTCVLALPALLPLLKVNSQLYRKPEIKRWRRVYYTLPAILSPLEGISILYRKQEIKRWKHVNRHGPQCYPLRGNFPTLFSCTYSKRSSCW